MISKSKSPKGRGTELEMGFITRRVVKVLDKIAKVCFGEIVLKKH